MNLEVQKELLAIKGNSELLLVDDVIDWARRHKGSVLHKQYNWNEKEAALEHWRLTTRNLIALSIVYETGERRFVSLTIDRNRPGGGFREVAEVVKVKALMEVMLDDALRELERVRLKYQHVKELASVWQAADKVRARQAKGRAA